jgi:DNA-binding SARP family transcriptional activator
MFTLRLLGGASIDGPDGLVAGRAALRQRMALLALLAVEHPRPLSRDRLLASLWPESGADEARHHLRDSLYILRSALGDDSVLGTGDDVRLNPDRLTCDLWEFDTALARDDLETAVAVYHGEFLRGFHLSDGEDFERWADGQRSRLTRRYGQALEQLAERAMGAGEPVRAVEWWSRLAGEDPFNSRIALRYMQALEAAGDRAGALRHAAAHSELLRTELDAVPERDVLVLAERLRRESGTTPAGVATSGPSSPPTPGAADLAEPERDSVPLNPPTPRRHRRWVLLAGLIALVAGVGVLGGALLRGRPPSLASRRFAAAAFENRTGQPELDGLGPMAADWIIRGLMEIPLVDMTEVEAVNLGPQDAGPVSDPRSLARQDGAATVIRGSYYRSADSILFQAAAVDVATGRTLRSFDPVGAPLERAISALEQLRERIATGLSLVVEDLQGYPVDPEPGSPPSLSSYREFVAGLQEQESGDWEREAEHYRRAAELDSSFVAPLIQLAFRATWSDRCSTTDSVGTVLDARRNRLPIWDRLTIDLLRARCRGDMAAALDLLGQRYRTYPRSKTAQIQYARALQRANQPNAARKILGHFDPERDLGWLVSPEEKGSRYWWYLAASWHMPGDYRAELDVTERWRDFTSGAWQVSRGRALAALGREREIVVLLQGSAKSSIGSVASQQLTIATELAVHGHPRAAQALAQSTLTRLQADAEAVSAHAEEIAWANRLLGRNDDEQAALERVVGSHADTLAKLEARGRIAVLRADTAGADRVDRILAEESGRELRNPWVRGAQLLARAHIAAGFGRREQAVALLQEASARGMLPLGSAHAFHADLLLTQLRGYPPFDALLQPDD